MSDAEKLLDQAWRAFYLDHPRAEQLGRELLAATEDIQAHPLRGYGWFHVAFAQIRIGEIKLAMDANQQARRAFMRHNDLRVLEDVASTPGLTREPIDLFVNHNSAASTHKLLGHIDEPLMYGYRALEDAERIPWPGPRTVALSNLGAYHYILGNFDQARVLTETAFTSACEAQARGLIGACGANLIEISHAACMPQK